MVDGGTGDSQTLYLAALYTLTRSSQIQLFSLLDTVLKQPHQYWIGFSGQKCSIFKYLACPSLRMPDTIQIFVDTSIFVTSIPFKFHMPETIIGQILKNFEVTGTRKYMLVHYQFVCISRSQFYIAACWRTFHLTFYMLNGFAKFYFILQDTLSTIVLILSTYVART